MKYLASNTSLSLKTNICLTGAFFLVWMFFFDPKDLDF